MPTFHKALKEGVIVPIPILLMGLLWKIGARKAYFSMRARPKKAIFRRALI